MGKKTVPFNPSGIEKLPENKPVIYRIESAGGRQNSSGSPSAGGCKTRSPSTYLAQRHPVPGSNVQIEQMPSIQDALKKEHRTISRHYRTSP